MSDHPKLLVVDDEEVICQACRRIFSQQGFLVATCSDPLEGLCLATEEDYAVILLDVKMPTMDGIQFLEGLRNRKLNVPVILITGYPDAPTAASAVRLGAANYITKPFTPEDITRAVHKVLRFPPAEENHASDSTPPGAEPWAPAAPDFHFLGESWFQWGTDRSVRVGAVLPRLQDAAIEALRLPRLGEVVYQGLPLAGLTIAAQPPRTVPAPLSGVVLEANQRLTERPSRLWDDPCNSGWIACLSPTRCEEEARHCSLRRVLLANADKASAELQASQLASLGCQVRRVKDWEELAPALQDPHTQVLVIDAASLGERDPELVRRVNAAAPFTKIVVIASPAAKWEAAYRKGRIFYYAVEPFADNEIVDVLDSAFRPQEQPVPQTEPRRPPPKPLGKICITTRRRQQICLLADAGLLRQGEGLAWQIEHKLGERLYTLESTFGDSGVTAVEILEAVSNCDRLLILLAKDIGRLPGSLLRDTKAQFVSVPTENLGQVTTLVVQPAASAGVPLDFDARTTTALAERIVKEMVLC